MEVPFGLSIEQIKNFQYDFNHWIPENIFRNPNFFYIKRLSPSKNSITFFLRLQNNSKIIDK